MCAYFVLQASVRGRLWRRQNTTCPDQVSTVFEWTTSELGSGLYNVIIVFLLFVSTLLSSSVLMKNMLFSFVHGLQQSLNFLFYFLLCVGTVVNQLKRYHHWKETWMLELEVNSTGILLKKIYTIPVLNSKNKSLLFHEGEGRR